MTPRQNSKNPRHQMLRRMCLTKRPVGTLQRLGRSRRQRVYRHIQFLMQWMWWKQWPRKRKWTDQRDQLTNLPMRVFQLALMQQNLPPLTPQLLQLPSHNANPSSKLSKPSRPSSDPIFGTTTLIATTNHCRMAIAAMELRIPIPRRRCRTNFGRSVDDYFLATMMGSDWIRRAGIPSRRKPLLTILRKGWWKIVERQLVPVMMIIRRGQLF
mmetsp:Transcript_17463/g.49984  ORF Transcript_17463/g.49984 Transcript_17463/m.49984 type:complete len:212 (+) Transcript_17463:2-637(+)